MPYIPPRNDVLLHIPDNAMEWVAIIFQFCTLIINVLMFGLVMNNNWLEHKSFARKVGVLLLFCMLDETLEILGWWYKPLLLDLIMYLIPLVLLVLSGMLQMDILSHFSSMSDYLTSYHLNFLQVGFALTLTAFSIPSYINLFSLNTVKYPWLDDVHFT
jgi:hypothetical protein